jgi:hypothetical protein
MGTRCNREMPFVMKYVLLTDTSVRISQVNVLRWIAVHADTLDVPAADACMSGV